MADVDKTTTCCFKATDEDIAENPEAYDCATCERATRLDSLWLENAEAWTLYQSLCGRMVRECRLEGVIVERYTRGWSVDQLLNLVMRLDILMSVLEPHGRSQDQHYR